MFWNIYALSVFMLRAFLLAKRVVNIKVCRVKYSKAILEYHVSEGKRRIL